MTSRIAPRDPAELGEILNDLALQIAQLKKRNQAGVVVSDDGEDASPALPPPSFWRDRYPTGTGTLGSGASGVTLTYTPLANSLHLYLNGLELDEGVDYTLADNEVTFTGTTPAGGDVIDARYAFTDVTPDTATVFPLSIVDTFERADGTTDFENRSDGGLWSYASGADGHWKVESNKGIKNTETGSSADEYIWAEYGDFDEVSAEAVMVWTGERFYEFGEMYLAMASDPATEGYYLTFEAIEGFFEIGKKVGGVGTDFAGTAFVTPSWGTGPRTIKLTFNRTTGELKAYFDGTLYLSHTDGSPLTGTKFALNFSEERAYYVDSITVGAV